MTELYNSKVAAGFPSPADDYSEGKLDLNTLLINNPAATFFVKASGDSMINAGIYSGDMLIVDRSLEAKHGKVVIAYVDSQFTVKRLHKSSEGNFLMPENEAYTPIKITEDTVIWGVVTNVIHKL